MPHTKVKLLIVDDEVSLRESLSQIFTTFGYSVRSAKDGLSALAEMRNDMPDIILSDLNMPGMSGFELLSVIRRRFPAIRVIAMSGAFSGDDGIPPGVAADAFFEKGSNPGSLLQIVRDMAHMDARPHHHERLPTPIWIAKNGHDPSGVEYVMMVCPDCLRTFPQTIGDATQSIREAKCIHCFSLIPYAIVRPVVPSSPLLSGSRLREKENLFTSFG